MVDEALALDAHVTVFNRGRSAPAPPGTTHVVGDRAAPADLQQLAGRHFDIVVDTCGYVPAEVRDSAELLAQSCDHYTFVSTINVFPGWPTAIDYTSGGIHAGVADATRADVPDGLSESQTYGWLKAGCERAVVRAFGPERCSVLRGGSLVGPHDSEVGRLPWWIDRIARGGEVLVPGTPDDPVALIDSRDLARFALSGAAGTYEVAGPSGRDSRADLIAACLSATGAQASCTYVPDDWLVEHDVQFWTELPLWAPRSRAPSVFAHHTDEAEAAGLRWRPLADTVAATWAWQRDLPGGWQPAERALGLASARESELLAAWHSDLQRP